jgi:heme-degrading monooxygenase HmoA
MFAVIFEAHPRPSRWDAYLGHAKVLRPELEQVDGFVNNIRYNSLTRDGWILSLSSWRDEKSVVRWRTRARHHEAQEQGRGEILLDYHLRVGQIIKDSHLPAGHELREQRLDETEVGIGTTVVLVDAQRPADWVKSAAPQDVASWLGHDALADGLVAWDIFDAILAPGDILLLLTLRDHASAERLGRAVPSGDGRRIRQVRVVRDYGMFDRREAPQYYPDVPRTQE